MHSSLYKKGIAGTLLPSHTSHICGVDIPYFLVGDSVYPMLPWLMKPFPQNLLNAEKRKYNYRVSCGRIVVKNTFGRLKGGWRRLMKKNDMLVENVPTIIAAACVLHNICEVHNEMFDDSWLMNDDTLSQPEVGNQHSCGRQRPKQTQDALVRYFSTHPL